MIADRFVNKRKDAWQRLEDLLKLLDGARLRRLHREEVRELGRIYRRTASDLAVARAEARDPRLVNYLNSLVVRAHGRIYRAEAREGGKRLREFFARDFPRTFRRTWRYTFASFVVFTVFAFAGFVGTWRDIEASELAGISAQKREYILRQKPRWWLRINEANQVEGSEITTNNIGVTFYAFAFGAMFGLGTLYILALNGGMNAALLAVVYRAGYGNELLTFMVGHGVIELSCIFIAGGAGLLIGLALLLPGDLSRADSLRLRGSQAVRLIIGCVPLLVIAGTIEGFISPAPIPAALKFTIAALTGIALYSYLILSGREAGGAVDRN